MPREVAVGPNGFPLSQDRFRPSPGRFAFTRNGFRAMPRKSAKSP